MNDLVINELSFLRFRDEGQPCAAATRAQARDWMAQVIQTLKEASHIGLSRIVRTCESFTYQELSPGYSMAHWRNDPAVSRDEQRLFRQYTTRMPLLDGVLQEIVERERGCEATFEGYHAKGLLAALLLDDLAISVPSDSVWDAIQLSIRVTELREDDGLSSTDELVPNAASPRYVRLHAPLIERRRTQIARSGQEIIEQRQELLPMIRFCGDTEEAILSMGENDGRLVWVKRSLFDLNDRCREWVEGDFPHERLRGSPSPESQTVQSNDRLRGMRVFACADGERRYFTWHLKSLALNLRLYYLPITDERIVLVGYVGKHLPTALY